MKRRVLIIGNNVYSMVRFRGGLIREMIATGYDVHLLVPSEDSVFGSDDEQSALLNGLGAAVHTYQLKRASLSPVSDLFSALTFAKTIRRLKPDVVMAYMMKPVVYGMVSAWLMGVGKRFALLDGLGFAFTDRGSTKIPLSALVTRKMLKAALSKAHHVLFLNNDDGATLRALGVLHGKTPSSVINGTGLDLKHFDGPIASEDSKTFVMISRLLRDKGVREFASAAKLVVARWPDARFVLVGDTDSAPGAIPVEEVKSWDWLSYVGPTPDVREHLQSSLAYILPSYREGRPRTVMEAMAMRRACIVTDVPGCRECIEHGKTGLVVPPRDAQALADAVSFYLENPVLAVRHGQEARLVAEILYPEGVVNRSVLRALGLTGNA